jgi:hypothetical protein
MGDLLCVDMQIVKLSLNISATSPEIFCRRYRKPTMLSDTARLILRRTKSNDENMIQTHSRILTSNCQFQQRKINQARSAIAQKSEKIATNYYPVTPFCNWNFNGKGWEVAVRDLELLSF